MNRRGALRRVMDMLITVAAAAALCLAVTAFYAEAETTEYHDSADDAAAELRGAMKQRKESVTIGLTGSTDQDGLKDAIGNLLERAVRHTGEPDEGDYLKFQYDTYKGEARTTDDEGVPAVEIDYRLTYYDDSGQEKAVSDAAAAMMDELELENMSEFEKITAIYDLICDRTKYEAAEDGDHVRRTAYGALVEGKAVCQGYSLALYRLLLEAGIDNRIIYGESVDPEGVGIAHTWNIVKLYGKYYYVDITKDDSSDSRDCFLRPAGSGFEADHRPDRQYQGEFFTEKYPMAEEEYRWDLRGTAFRIARSLTAFEEAVREGCGQ